jgi:hypothetical protein
MILIEYLYQIRLNRALQYPRFGRICHLAEGGGAEYSGCPTWLSFFEKNKKQLLLPPPTPKLPPATRFAANASTRFRDLFASQRTHPRGFGTYSLRSERIHEVSGLIRFAANASTRFRDLFASQRTHRIGHGRSHRLKTDGQKRDAHRQPTGQREHPPLDVDPKFKVG